MKQEIHCMTSYTADTFSLTQYSYEVDALPRLTSEETSELGQRILLANQHQIPQTEGMAARDAIIHGHLHLVLSLAQRYPYDLREDLIQEGNIGLIDAVELYSFRDGGDFTSYAIVAIRHAFTNAMEFILPIRIPRTSLRTAKAAGTADQLYDMQPVNLDKPSLLDDEESLADTLLAPDRAETPQEHTHASSVEGLLEALPGMVRLVIELRYGLDEEDQRQHSYAEVAGKLGISKSFASKLEHEGLAILNGKHIQPDQLKLMAQESRQTAQESRLNAAYVLLQQPQMRISSRKLARAAKVRGDVAAAYLLRIKQSATQDNQIVVNTLGEKTYTKLLHAYHRLQEEQNDTVSVLALQKAAGVHWYTAKKFLDYRAQLAAQQLEQVSVCREAVEA
jgi:RNA polymerase sigma factor (sigma-70 family)